MNTFLSILLLPLLVLTCQQDKKADFEKIIFHTTGCFGNCPTYHLQIDGDKTVKLHAERVYKSEPRAPRESDSLKTGYFKGTLSDDVASLLETELRTIGLDTLNFDGVRCCDGSVRTIIVYYNGKRKFLQSMFPPPKAKKLISILNSICEANTLSRTQEKFVIESDNTDK